MGGRQNHKSKKRGKSLRKDAPILSHHPAMEQSPEQISKADRLFRLFINLCTILGVVGIVLGGTIIRIVAFIALILCLPYVAWELRPWLTPFVRRRRVMSLLIFVSGGLLVGGASGYGLWKYYSTPSIPATTTKPLTAAEIADEVAKRFPKATEAHGVSDSVTARVTRAEPKPAHTTKEPTFSEEDGPFTVVFSSGVLHFGKDQKEADLLSIEGKPVAKAFVENNKLYVDAILSDGLGGPPVELKHNRLTFRNQRWDRNYDDSALEIVTNDLVPIFQLVYRNPRTVVVRGIFIIQNKVIVADENRVMIDPPSPVNAAFKRIFKYPSRIHQGEELESDHQ